MNPTLLREAADRLESLARRYWETNPNRLDCDTRPPFCSMCMLDMPAHKPACIISRLREEADRVKRLAREGEAELAKTFCHYPAPSDFNSCCPQPDGKKRCQVAARAMLSAYKPADLGIDDSGKGE